MVVKIKKAKRNRIIVIALLAATVIMVTVAFVMLWLSGAFLPKWIKWGNVPADTSFLKKGVKVQDTMYVDIDFDGSDELLVLCWRIGRYGDRKPFWVKHDENKWSQHIYIYEDNDGEITPKWMASNIYMDVAWWESYGNHFIINHSPDGGESVWMWNSFGLEKVSDELFEKYRAKMEMESGSDAVQADESDNEQETEYETEADAGLVTGYGSDEISADSDDSSISIIMVGDILLHDGVTASCRYEDGTYDYSSLFANTADVIREADIAIVNQEVIIGGEELRVSGYPAFNAPYEVGDALYDAGFDVVCHATNHALDRGKNGISNCLDYWRDNHPDMAVLGIHDREEDASNVYIRDIGDAKIAILNYTYGTNGIPMPQGMPYAVELLEKNKIAEDLAYAEENADFTIVCPHWGTEYKLKESSEQESMAKFMTENGADLIIGTHPHVIEPVKWIETENGNRALCYYSLGNFINWTAGRGAGIANRMVGGMASVSLNVSDEAAVDADMIVDYKVYPLVSHIERVRGGITTYFLDDYTEDLAEKNAIIGQAPDFSYDYCASLCRQVWEDETLYMVSK